MHSCHNWSKEAEMKKIEIQTDPSTDLPRITLSKGRKQLWAHPDPAAKFRLSPRSPAVWLKVRGQEPHVLSGCLTLRAFFVCVRTCQPARCCACWVLKKIPASCSIVLGVQRLVEPFLGLQPLGYFSGKALGPRSLFFLFFGNYGALCENKGIWILFRKNVTYKQIALENLGLTLSAWVRHRESPTLCCFLAGNHLLFLFCMLSLAAQRAMPPLLASPFPLFRAQVFASAPALSGMFLPSLSASPQLFLKTPLQHLPLSSQFPRWLVAPLLYCVALDNIKFKYSAPLIFLFFSDNNPGSYF
ncbi:uncharacterized protein LOC101680667 [Mustela putorius furo]|uniref:Uncharacterized protein LOC101680667 n=1 Tax=Mustela putorius furo TaxID=9669 RepID=A0A8U0MR78_MUSPF|nr:uncharacterized protein LOC101680667 [Mustela putorius furo]